jgi:two-component system cell cycle sensor histidine kinase/response regulator CckA
MALVHLDDRSNRNYALVGGLEVLYAAPTVSVEQRLLAKFQASPTSLLHGLLAGDDANELGCIVEQLQSITGVALAFVGELCGEDWDRVRTVELRSPSGREENCEYDLRDTPCATVVGQTACVYPGKVRELFPKDEFLVKKGVDSYAGVPLFDPGGRPLGLVALLDKQPWSEEQVRETMSLMFAFRPRIEAVLISRRARRDLQMLSERLEGGSDQLGCLVRTFAHAMNVRCAFVAQATDETARRMRTVATAVDGKLRDPVEYELAGTRVSEVEAAGEILIRGGLDEAWPQARSIASFPPHACLVLRLSGPDGRMIGQLGLIHDRLLNRRIGEQPVTRAFRQQIAFELHRHMSESERLATERRLLELQRTEGLGILAGGIAHDFNNLLVGVLGNADLALVNFPLGCDDDTRECLIDIRDAATAAMQLCRQMLAYAGRTAVESQRFDVAAQVVDLARLLASSIPHTIELVVEPSESCCWIDGDVVQIRQVLMNLITNASDAIFSRDPNCPGKITVSVASMCTDEDERPITGVTGTLAPGNYVCLSVCDTGCGMDEATRTRIFDPFFTTKPRGHGLGLAAMLGVVRAHGGTLTVESEPGVGSCFTLYLPAADAGANESRATPEPAPSPARSVRVLVVDDEPRVRKVAQRMLERANYQVVTANDGLEALEIFQRQGEAIDCVVLDLGMPRLGGIETMQRLRALDPELPVILSSGYSQIHALDVLADDRHCLVVHKPYDIAQLTGAVAELSASRRE